MPSDVVVPPQSPPTGPDARPESDAQRVQKARIIAIVTGLLGMLLALATPFLPVDQKAASVSWPQDGSLNSVSAPLISYSPTSLDITIPCPALGQLGEDGGTLVSTMPNGAPDRDARGLTVRTTADRLEAITRESVLISAPLGELTGCTALTITSDYQQTVATVTGIDGLTTTLTGDYRPQVVGIFTDLQGAPPAGLSVDMDIDSRFSSSPTLLKLFAMIVAALSTIVSLYALHRIDGVDGRRARRFLPARWWKFTGVDGLVIGTLLLWHVVGANTSDDGYLLGMARVSEHSGYMANYFRWFGVPEAPFGWYYDVLAAFTKVSTASMWMRLPALIAGILCWMVISREVIPRLGVAVRRNKVAIWTGGLVFLAFWLPYNNGLRPEPIIALGALLTWCSIERAVATGRLLPAAVAVLIAAFSLAAGPSGLIAIGALLAGARPIVQILIARGKRVGFFSQIMPVLAAGTVVLVAVFADQTLATVLESTRVRTAIGPNVPWFEERVRWDALMTISPDGSLARRFGMFVMIVGLIFCVMLILRKGRIPGTAIGPSRRILGIVFASLLLMQFTPTKWTHHFGVYAGLAATVAVLAAVGVSASSMRSKRNRALFAAGILFILAVAFTSSNGWWYVSSYGVPWWDKPPSIAGKGFSTAFLGLTILALLLAAWFHVREPLEKSTPKKNNGRTARLLAASPLTIAAGAVVLFEVLSLVKGAVAQYPAYSIGKSNVESVFGGTCGLAGEVLVESDPDTGVLQLIDRPADLAGAGAFGATESTGFTPDGVASDLTADAEDKAAGSANSLDTTTSANGTTTPGTGAGTGGGSASTAGINGSNVALPFGLDPATTPVLGSFGSSEAASLTTGWYALPQRSDAAPLLTIAAAGRIRYVDTDGIVTPGAVVHVEYGKTQADGSVTALGQIAPIDIGPSPSWRNLRVPMDQLPADADTVRVIASDSDIGGEKWVALTPPRVSDMRTLQSVVGSTDPVLMDWAVGLAFPCQRPVDHLYGVAEVPDWRILPDRIGAESTNAWQDHYGGGPLGWTSELLAARTLPTYLDNDWDRDWGSLEQYTPLDPAAEPAQIDVTTETRSGTWTPGPIRYQS
ncbi:arabinosyltransferase domain-containing protein [Rhodococcus globerulus]|uniref:arabinosyltransferase domain-containing protein n=1 Tax=Rhodococcus globerulus TaxID=33008 RepID=UPI003CC8D253